MAVIIFTFMPLEGKLTEDRIFFCILFTSKPPTPNQIHCEQSKNHKIMNVPTDKNKNIFSLWNYTKVMSILS